MTDTDVSIRPSCSSDHSWIDEIVAEHFCSSRVVSGTNLYEARDLPGLIAERAGHRTGLLLYRIDGSECEVVVLIASPVRHGTGRRLLESAHRLAQEADCTRLWLNTTNNNFDGIAFYRSVGMTLVAIHYGAVRESRRLKPEIPEKDSNGIPIEDTYEFELCLERR